MTRSEYLDWSKARAKSYLAHGDIAGAYGSLATDLRAHPELAGHPGIEQGHRQIMAGFLNSPGEMDRFIDGFN